MWWLLAMLMNDAGMVMNANADTLPRGCEAISRDYEFHIEGGTDFAGDWPGRMFGFSEPALRVRPCSRITVSFSNRDQVRHQWMVHGLPRYLYPGGMFHIEANGGHTVTGTFIVPGDDKTYLLHCDMAQHMEKGMKGQLMVGAGSGDLWSVAQVSDAFERDRYLPSGDAGGRWLLLAGVLLFSAAWVARRFAGKQP